MIESNEIVANSEALEDMRLQVTNHWSRGVQKHVRSGASQVYVGVRSIASEGGHDEGSSEAP